MRIDRHRVVTDETVATIGNFDGVHKGHVALIRQVREFASHHGLPSTVILFEPQPEEVLYPGTAAPRLMRLTEKLRRLRETKVDRIRCLRFDHTLANMSAQNFIRRILQEKIRARAIVSGRDFRFGRGREGDLSLLRECGNFELVCIPDMQHAGRRISSSAIRKELAAGRLDEARELLGRSYSLRGLVMRGAGRGRQLGFATANLRVQHPILEGVYVSRTLLDNHNLPSVSYLGRRPSFAGSEPMLETHLLDFDGGELYGRQIEVTFLHHLRAEGHFSDIKVLRQQVQLDIEAARQYHCPSQHAHT